MDTLTLTYQGKTFNQREDGYINLGQLCATHGKRFRDWSILNSAKAYLEALSETLTESHCGISRSVNSDVSSDNLVVTTLGGSTGSQTWVHPLIASEVAYWVDPVFGTWCDKQTGADKIRQSIADFFLE